MNSTPAPTPSFGRTVTIITDPEQCLRMDEEQAIMDEIHKPVDLSNVTADPHPAWQPPSCPLSSTYGSRYRF